MKKNRKFQAALIIFSLTGQIAWVVENMYFNVFIYKMFRASASDIALMVTASAIAATLTTILMGALSDRIGKRKIFMCAGYIAWGISIISFALIRKDGLRDDFLRFHGKRRRIQRMADRFHGRHQPRGCRRHQFHDAADIHPGGVRRIHGI